MAAQCVHHLLAGHATLRGNELRGGVAVTRSSAGELRALVLDLRAHQRTALGQTLTRARCH